MCRPRSFGIIPCLLLLGPWLIVNEAHKTAYAQEDKTLAVLDLIDKGPSVELAVLRTAFAEMLSGDLSQYQGIRVVERVQVAQFLREANLQKGLRDTEAVQRAGQALAAEYLLTGSFRGEDKTVTLDVSLFETGKNEPLLRWKRSGPVEKLIDLEQELTGKVLKALGIDQPLRRPPPKPKKGPSPLVVVLALRNLSPSGKLDPMESGFADILQANLGALKDVRLVERERLYEVLKEQKLSLSGLVDSATAIKVGKLLGAERLIYGSFVQLNGTLHLNVRLADTKTTEILATETAHGLLDNFADLIEDTSLCLAADLAIQPQENAAELVKAATPTRKLEAAIHFANGQRFFFLERYADSAKAYERVLLVDPANKHAGLRRVRAWKYCKEYRKAIEAAEEALGGDSLPARSSQRYNLYSLLIGMHRSLHEYDACIRVYEKMFREFPQVKSRAWEQQGYADALMGAKRFDDAVSLLEKTLRSKNAWKNAPSYKKTLKKLYVYYSSLYSHTVRSPEFQRRKNARDLPYMRNISAQTKKIAERTLVLYDLIVTAATGKRSREWRLWASNNAIDGVAPRYVDEQGYIRSAGKDLREKRLCRAIEVFGWVPNIAWKAHLELREIREKSGKWKDAIESNRYIIDNAETSLRTRLPDSWDSEDIARTSCFDRKIEALWQIGRIYQRELKEPERAIASYKRLVNEFGVAHNWGANVAVGLHELGEELALPEKTVLIWGGGAPAQQAWAKRLKPLGYTAHSVGLHWIDAGHLCQYPLVVLVRTGTIALTPDDVLALRHYVATGGSLLVVLSPGWESAQPGIHNSLLSFFDLHAGQEMVVRARSTRIAKHPITHGINNVTAKCAVNIEGPREAVLISAGDHNLLAATTYRHGRVVVASLGQWFLPDPGLVVRKVSWNSSHRKTNISRDQWPIEPDEKQEVALLQNVVAWLLEPDQQQGDLRQSRAPFIHAQLASLRSQLRVLPREKLQATMDRLVAETKPGVWKEEAFWAAGEASLRLVYWPGTPHEYVYGWKWTAPVPEPWPTYHEHLLNEFSDSPLKPCAQLRLADCMYRKVAAKVRWSTPQVPSYYKEFAGWFDKVKASEGTYAWAWAHLRCGEFRFKAGQFETAKDHFRQVAERMDLGAEKVLGLINLGLCYEAMNNTEEAMRVYKAAITMPNVTWAHDETPYSSWKPMSHHRREGKGSTNRLAKKRLQRLGAAKGK